MSTAMLYSVYHTDNKKKNNDLGNIKDEIEQIPEGEIQIERPDKIVDIFGKITDFNK